MSRVKKHRCEVFWTFSGGIFLVRAIEILWLCFFVFLPLRWYLNSLVRIRHHSNEQIDKYNHWHQHVNAKDNFEQVLGPIWLRFRGVRGQFINLCLIGGGLTKYSEKEQFKGRNRIHAHWWRRRRRGRWSGSSGRFYLGGWVASTSRIGHDSDDDDDDEFRFGFWIWIFVLVRFWVFGYSVQFQLANLRIDT